MINIKKSLPFSFLFFILLILLSYSSISAKKCDLPNFSSGYSAPQSQPFYNGSAFFDSYGIVLMYALVMAITGYILFKKRSRRGIVIVMILSVAFFGFLHKGCVCPVGSIQNIVLAFSSSTYVLPISVLLLFLVPLITAFFWGRLFCAAACPLGAMQDLILIKGIKLPNWLNETLRSIPYFYLFLIIISVISGSGFLLCRFDPFVPFFRQCGSPGVMIFATSLLLLSMIIGRPYCRFMCPYGLMLGWISRLSKNHVTITPNECVECRLCEESCPFMAIHKSSDLDIGWKDRKRGVLILRVMVLLIPVWMTLFGLAGYRLAQSQKTEKSLVTVRKRIAVYSKKKMTAKVNTYQTKRNLLLDKKRSLARSGALVGVIMGLLFGLHAAGSATFKPNQGFEPHKGHCFSCGRCIEFCPVGRATQIGGRHVS